MKKKILTLLYVLILHSNAHSASEPQLPPPLPSSEEIINSENKGNSFWDKTLNFFGLGNKKQENKKVYFCNHFEDTNRCHIALYLFLAVAVPIGFFGVLEIQSGGNHCYPMYQPV